MRNKFNKGFTLIEIIIVVVILGVLAAIALPRLTGQVAKSRAAEAFNTLGILMGKVSECYTLESETLASCNTVALLNTNTGYTMPTSVNFTYAFDATTCAAAATCSATATAIAGKGNGVITYSVNLATGAVTQTGTADFASVSKQ